MRLGKVQASGYVAEMTEGELTQELAPETPEPAVSELEQVPATG